MGTLLYSRGIPQRACLDEVVLTHPEVVSTIHREYLEAGADAIETEHLRRQSVPPGRIRAREEWPGQINRRAAQLAREARDVAGRDVLVAGSIGPLGPSLRVQDRPHPGLARAAFREQIEGLLEGGVDLLRVRDLRRPRHAAGGDRGGRARLRPAGHRPDDLRRGSAPGRRHHARRRGRGSDRSGRRRRRRQLRRGPAAPAWKPWSRPGRPTATVARSLQPNAGLPQRDRGAVRLLGRARVLRGDGAAHDRAPEPRSSAAAAARRRPTRPRCGPRSTRSRPRAAAAPRSRRVPDDERARRRRRRPRPAPPAASWARTARRLRRRASPASSPTGTYVISVEIDPPRSIRIDRTLDAARLLEAAGRRPGQHQRLGHRAASGWAPWPWPSASSTISISSAWST